MRFHELKNVLRVNNVPHGSLPLDPFLQSSVEFELIRTFTKNFSEIFDTERERRDPHFIPLVVAGMFLGNLQLLFQSEFLRTYEWHLSSQLLTKQLRHLATQFFH